jgi:hypothetical protein
MKKPMRFPVMLLCPVLVLANAMADPLSSADREALLESLEKIRETADSKVDARFRVAIAAYRDAMNTDETAIEFYLKCIEKVNFLDQERKTADFRDWKRKEGDRLSDQAFRLALRYQLRWLILTLQASSEKANARRAQLADAQDDGGFAMFRDATKLEGAGPNTQSAGDLHRFCARL